MRSELHEIGYADIDPEMTATMIRAAEHDVPAVRGESTDR